MTREAIRGQCGQENQDLEEDDDKVSQQLTYKQEDAGGGRDDHTLEGPVSALLIDGLDAEDAGEKGEKDGLRCAGGDNDAGEGRGFLDGRQRLLGGADVVGAGCDQAS